MMLPSRSDFEGLAAELEGELHFDATIRSLYHQRREALIHHERQENLPPPASFSLNGRPAAPGQSGTAMLSDPTTVSEVSR